MDCLYDSIRALDVYAMPLTVGFEDGLVASNDHNVFTARTHGNTLGHAVQRIKSKLSVRVRQKISRFAKSNNTK